MYKFKYFWQENCPKCAEAKKVIQRLKANNLIVEEFDIGTKEGLAEAALHGLLSTPSLILCEVEPKEDQPKIECEFIVYAWQGDINLSDIRPYLASLGIEIDESGQ